MNRTKGILAAGTLTGLVIITLLGLGFGNMGAAADVGTAVPQQTIPQEPQVDTSDPAAAEAVQAWQAYSTELEDTVRVLQERENTYQANLDAANDTIINLQDQVNSANSSASSAVYSEGDEDGHEGDHDDYDHEEHEDHDDDDHVEHEDHDDDD